MIIFFILSFEGKKYIKSAPTKAIGIVKKRKINDNAANKNNIGE